MVNEGIFSAVVWPTYIGAAVLEGGSINEPTGGGYERGSILWSPVKDARQLVGHARITCPPGEYTHFVFFHHPTNPVACGVRQMDHPVRFTEPLNVLDVGPIDNGDLRLNHLTEVHP